ncbi:Holliday junction resolvase RuvX [Neolewinella agarilytica]|uniref:Putative pre-16S rRNA nuclease n=1 Tax=Neolewinella agarilytica TaxID=478744 RepID=A0A1H9IQ88_9BACT|nr:Holliday junction resolvase RuvX [Neolewinella agarilytica]SEQ76931.1 putative holliday junction resolvase [Neolewinella agarilytica]
MRILAIDYGSKKCGIAASDPLRIIATGLETIPTWQLFDWLKTYLEKEPVGDLVIGESLHKDGKPNKIHEHVIGFERKFAKLYPEITLHRQDEFRTSKRAMEALIEMGVPKMKRREKERIDKMAATIILQDFMESIT